MKLITTLKQEAKVNYLAGEVKRLSTPAGSGAGFPHGELFELIRSNIGTQLPMLTDLRFLRDLHDVAFTEGNISVGKGEVLITLFTEAKNPKKKGDLVLPPYDKSAIEIELKAGAGRPGKTGTWERITAFENMLKGKMETTYEEEMINIVSQLREPLLNNIQELLNAMHPEAEHNREAQPAQKKKLQTEYDIIHAVYVDVEKSPRTSYKQICQDLEKIKKYYKPSSVKYLQPVRETIPEIIQWLMRLQSEINVVNAPQLKGAKAGNTVITKAHFGAYDITKDFAKTLGPGSIDSMVEDIAAFAGKGNDAAVQSVIRDNIIGTNYTPSDAALKIIGAIQILDYSIETEFDYYMLVAYDSENLESNIGKFIIIGPLGSTADYVQALNNCIGQLFKYNAIISPDTGGRSKGGYNVEIQ